MIKLRIVLPGLLAALALAGCSDTRTEVVSEEPADLCQELGTVCNDPSGMTTCDPADGVCKCGGKGGVVCGAGTVCNLDNNVSPPAPTCVSEKCSGVICGRYESCDANDGDCKCGGVKCAYGEYCDLGVCVEKPACEGIVCREGEVCDPTDRTCKCGGDICSVGESCRQDEQGQGYCVGRRCVGVNCPGDTVCSPVDGLCHCGGADGDVCTAGQACVVTDGVGACEGHDICDDKVCSGNTTCSPLDGECRCGGYDAVAPICGEGQTCDLTRNPPKCVGGEVCGNVHCAEGTNLSCDEETGECRCGGTGGILCGAEEGCVASHGQPTCVTRCDPNAANVLIEVCGHTAGEPKGCYLSPADGIAFCAPAGTAGDGQPCEGPTDCSPDYHCVQTTDGGICRRYCDTSVTGDCFVAERSCVPLAGRPASMDKLGVCMLVSP